MKLLEVVHGNAINAYKNANEEGKKILADLFGKNKLEVSITERVKTYEDACEVLGIDPIEILPFANPTTGDQKACNLLMQLRIINRALCEDWVADFNDGSQRKWRPWFEYNSSSSSFRFYDSCSVFSHAGAGSGVRLVFKTEELANYFGKQFLELHSNYLLTQ